jgi:hypothetical protein
MVAKHAVAAESQAIYRVETVPPPEGEDDAYGAITKIGSFSTGQIAELMERADDGPVSGVHAKAGAAPEIEVLGEEETELEPSALAVPDYLPVTRFAIPDGTAAPVLASPPIVVRAPTSSKGTLVAAAAFGFLALGGLGAGLAYFLLG